MLVAMLCCVHRQALSNPSEAGDHAGWGLAKSLREGPGRRFGHAMAYDPLRDRMLVFGGTDENVAFADLWALSLSEDSAWVRLSPLGTPPGARMGPTMIFDPTPPRMILFGGWGWDSTGGRSYVDAWALDLGDSLHWELLRPSGESPSGPLNHHSAVYDPVRDRMVIFGGGKKEVWALSLGEELEWTKLAPTGKSAPALEGHSAVYDPKHDRMLVFGGVAGNYSPLMKLSGNPPTKTWNQVWALSLSDPPVWTELELKGDRPSERYYHTATMDALHDRMLVFSGGHSRGKAVADLWALSLEEPLRWTRLTPPGAHPDARRMHAAAIDTRRARVLISGGALLGSYEGWFAAMDDEWWFPIGAPDSMGIADPGLH
jgi:hypothetical protein